MSLYAVILSLECLKMYLLIYKLVFSLVCDHRVITQLQLINIIIIIIIIISLLSGWTTRGSCCWSYSQTAHRDIEEEE